MSGNTPRRFLVSVLLGSILFFQISSLAQTGAYKADLLTLNGKNVATNEIEVILGTDAIELWKPKETSAFRSISYSAIVSAEYSYSTSPSIAEGSGGVLLLGLTGVPLFFNSKKRNWLSINAGQDSAIIDLRSSNYRTLLLQLQQKKVSVIDLGDRNEKKKKGAESKENKVKNDG